MDKLQAKRAALIAEYPEQVAEATWQEAQAVLNDSAKQVPVKTGYLKESGYVYQPYIDINGNVRCEIGYWANYAEYVHNLPYQHPRGGNWHFLYGMAFSPMDKRAPNIVKNIGNRAYKMIQEKSD